VLDKDLLLVFFLESVELLLLFLLFYHFYIYLHVYTLFGPPLPSSYPTIRFWAEPALPLDKDLNISI
jgi:hypothetical protein